MFMPRAPMEKITENGRPQKEIDWKLVDEYLIAGCPGTKIADALGIHAETLYDRCQMEKGLGFSAYSQQKRSNGDALLHKAQYDYAVDGDTALLIFLGKTRLEQRETQEIAVAQDTVQALKSMMAQLEEMQGIRRNKAENEKSMQETKKTEVGGFYEKLGNKG